MAIEAIVVTIPAVLLIPRDRQSPLFDRVLWIATWLLAFLGAWSAPSFITLDDSLNNFLIADVSFITTMIGALVGALSINVLLWLMDRFSGQVIEEDTVDETPVVTEEQNVGEHSNPVEH
jgi:hypothetical protein